MSTKEREIKPIKRKNKKLKSSGRNGNKTSDSDENQAFAKEKNDLLRQIDFLNSIILDTKLKEPNKSPMCMPKRKSCPGSIEGKQLFIRSLRQPSTSLFGGKPTPNIPIFNWIVYLHQLRNDHFLV
ncbi:hypothetical protein TNCV_1166951 [Trichonephila clavipes]|uniref:Uncharacterized protein n=1 Tax=Trichonephila clavipes TaxID=2585209 RepID=A0A8X6T0T1_TRICX|nr:hypothetical protein TNCV_1166951 [Trichonephila clavipes]